MFNLNYFKLFFITFLLVCHSCKNTNDQQILLDESKYYELIHLAEIEILRDNYKSADILYKRAFDSHNYMFAKDLNNAIRCSAILKNWKKVSLYAEQLILKGAGLNYFEDSIFDDFKETEFWSSFYDNYSELESLYRKHFCKELYTQLNELVNLDQLNYCEIPNDNNYDELKSTLTPTIDVAFSELIKKYGFPSEEKIGVNFNDDGKISFTPFYSVLYTHSFQSGDYKLIDESKPYIDSLLLDQRIVKNIINKSNFIQTTDNDSIYVQKSLGFDRKLNLDLDKIRYTLENNNGFQLSNQGLVFSDFSDSISKKNFYKYHKSIGILKID